MPLLQEEFVTSGIIKEHVFLAGYGASQAIPGPLFTFSSYIGMFLKSGGTNWTAGFGIAIRLELLLIPVIAGHEPYLGGGKLVYIKTHQVLVP